MLPDTLPAFLLTATILTMVPGLDTAVVLRTAAMDGPRAGVGSAMGIALGCLCWGAAAAFGLAALLESWPLAFDLLRLSGGAYLAWLGAKFLLRLRLSISVERLSDSAGTISGAIRRGFTTNILNPKVGAFYLTLLPQFVPSGPSSGAQACSLAASHSLIVIGWFSLLAVFTGVVRPWLQRPAVVRMLDRTTGGILMMLGVQLVGLRS
ncbi:LysE family translocator [Sphingomonas sp.]|uniref:LysE family translocator n=1 Tax=Sphingomonas sp. TaxID=28214 RepID=UPI003B3BABED